MLVVSGTTTGFTTAGARFNNDTGGNYNWVNMDGDGSSASSVTSAGATDMRFTYNWTFNTSPVCNVVMQVFDYTQTNKHKSVLIRGNRSDAAVDARAGRWGNTAAINRVDVLAFSTSWAAGSTFSLYGIEG